MPTALRRSVRQAESAALAVVRAASLRHRIWAECAHTLSIPSTCPNLRQRLEVSGPIRYHRRLRFQGFPVFFSGRPQRWQATAQVGARCQRRSGCWRSAPSGSRRQATGRRSAIAWRWPQLPPEAQAVHAADPRRRPVRLPEGRHRVRQSRTPAAAPSRAATTANTRCATPGARDRGARRIVCGGTRADGAGGLLLHRRPLRELSPDRASERRPDRFFYDQGGTRPCSCRQSVRTSFNRSAPIASRT